jgi:hypothetical protein
VELLVNSDIANPQLRAEKEAMRNTTKKGKKVACPTASLITTLERELWLVDIPCVMECASLVSSVDTRFE